MSDDVRAWGRLEAHRFFKYRQCAPDETNPRMCAGDDTVPRSVFYGPPSTDDDQPAEGQRERHAREETARALCARCPIVEACRAYAIGDGERVREPHGIWAGTTPGERRTELKRRLAAEAQAEEAKPLPVGFLRTPQKQTVLAALAMHDDIGKVVLECEHAEVGLDERAVLWQISRLYTLLRVPPEDRSPDALLAAARAAGVLPEPERLTSAVQPEAVDLDALYAELAHHAAQTDAAADTVRARVVRPAGRDTTTGTTPRRRPARTVVPFRRDRFLDVPGQLAALDPADLAPTRDAEVIPLGTPAHARALGAAA